MLSGKSLNSEATIDRHRLHQCCSFTCKTGLASPVVLYTVMPYDTESDSNSAAHASDPCQQGWSLINTGHKKLLTALKLMKWAKVTFHTNAMVEYASSDLIIKTSFYSAAELMKSVFGLYLGLMREFLWKQLPLAFLFYLAASRMSLYRMSLCKKNWHPLVKLDTLYKAHDCTVSAHHKPQFLFICCIKKSVNILFTHFLQIK